VATPAPGLVPLSSSTNWFVVEAFEGEGVVYILSPAQSH